MPSVTNRNVVQITQNIVFDEKDKKSLERVMEIINLILYPDFENPYIDNDEFHYRVMVKLYRSPWDLSTKFVQSGRAGEEISPDRLDSDYCFNPDDLKTLRDMLIILCSSGGIRLFSNYENESDPK